MTSLSENKRRKLRLPALLAALVLLFSLPACSVGSSAVSSDTASVSSKVSSAPESSSDTPSSDTTSFEAPLESPLTSFFSSDYVKSEYEDEHSSAISSEVHIKQLSSSMNLRPWFRMLSLRLCVRILLSVLWRMCKRL